MSGSDSLPAVIRLRGVSRSFGSYHALDCLDLEVHAGERVAVLGPSGAGKSTLLALLNGSLAPSSGSVEVLGEELSGLSASRRRAVQRRIGSIDQRLGLVEQVRVLHNVNAGRLARWSTARALASLFWPRDLDEVRHALERVELGWALHERTERLSGGERQRVAIARLLVQRPDLVLADEPVSSLDPVRAADVLALLGDRTLARTLVTSLHQPSLAREHCTRAIGLREGRLVFDVSVGELDESTTRRLYTHA